MASKFKNFKPTKNRPVDKKNKLPRARIRDEARGRSPTTKRGGKPPGKKI